jgi:hypothetical protein
MQNTKQPSKEQIRSWLAKRRQFSTSLPSIDEIRYQLDWASHGKMTPAFVKSNPKMVASS